MTASRDDRILFDVDADNRIATITLNNPERRNSYDAAMREGVARCLDHVAEDDDITVVLLRGVDGVFSTGADMNNAYGWYGDERASEVGALPSQAVDPSARRAGGPTGTAEGAQKRRPSQRRRLTVDR